MNPTAIESYAGIDDPGANLGPDSLVEMLFVSEERVTGGGELRTASELGVASGFAVASRDPKERVDA